MDGGGGAQNCCPRPASVPTCFCHCQPSGSGWPHFFLNFAVSDFAPLWEWCLRCDLESTSATYRHERCTTGDGLSELSCVYHRPWYRGLPFSFSSSFCFSPSLFSLFSFFLRLVLQRRAVYYDDGEVRHQPANERASRASVSSTASKLLRNFPAVKINNRQQAHHLQQAVL